MLLPQSHNPPRKQQPSVQEELQPFGNKLDEDEGGSRLCKSKRKSFGSEIGCDNYIARFRCFCSISTCDSKSLHFFTFITYRRRSSHPVGSTSPGPFTALCASDAEKPIENFKGVRKLCFPTVVSKQSDQANHKVSSLFLNVS